MENASAPRENSRRRQDGALRREIVAVRRMVCHAAQLSRRRIDYRRFRKFSRFTAAQGHSPGDEKRDARRGNNFAGTEVRRHFVEDAVRVSEKNRAELHKKRVVAGAQFSPVFPARHAGRFRANRTATNQRRARTRRSAAYARRLYALPETKPRKSARRSRWRKAATLQGRWRPDFRSTHG